MIRKFAGRKLRAKLRIGEPIGVGRQPIGNSGLNQPAVARQPSCEQLQNLRQLITGGRKITADLMKVVSRLKGGNWGTESNNSKDPAPEDKSQVLAGSVSLTVAGNFGLLNQLFRDGSGLVQAGYRILDGKVTAGVAYLDSVTDKALVSSQIIEPLLKGRLNGQPANEELLRLIQEQYLYVPAIKKTRQMRRGAESLLNGDTVLFINGVDTALIIGSRKGENRAIDQPANEGTVLASRDSFVEDLAINHGMVIKRLPTSKLQAQIFFAGELSHTKLELLWLEGIANMKAVAEVRRRIKRITVDNIDGVGNLAELIEDQPGSLFPKYKQTERPDVTARSLAEGRFVVLCNNSPFAFIAPISFWDNFKSMDDYAERATSASYLRIARYLAFIISVIISPLYLAFVTYNHIIVPQSLAVNITTGREGVPFPSVVELLIMTFAITVIREASLRLPGAVGYFVGTLAAIVIGQAAVAAGYVSAAVIIVVAVSAISSFAIATNTLVYTSQLINYFFIILAGIFGMFGLVNGIVLVFWHVMSLESFGVPYLYPLVPFELAGMKDTFVRLRFLKKRLRILAPLNQAERER